MRSFRRGVLITGLGVAGLLLAAVFSGSCALALILWAGGGERLARWLLAGRRLLWFNRLLALSLAGTAVWLASA